jgi:hypothetical protein
VLKDMRAAFDRLANRIDTVETNVAVLAASAEKNTQAGAICHCNKDQGKKNEFVFLHFGCIDLSRWLTHERFYKYSLCSCIKP